MKRSPLVKLFFFASLLIIGLSQATSSNARPAADDKSAIGASQEKGTIVARLKDYDPTVDGFNIHNYGRYEGLENELDAGDLIRLFGAENICESGSTAQDCVLYEPAEEWLEKQFKMLSNGCEANVAAQLHIVKANDRHIFRHA